MDDPEIPGQEENVDQLSPETGSGQEGIGFSTKAQGEFLGGSSQEVKPLIPQQHPKETGIHIHKTIEVNGKEMGYYETGPEDAEYTVLNISGLGAGSGEGNLRLDNALNGRVEGSIGMQALRENLPKGAQKIEETVQSLEGRYRTITPQLPGFGYSEALENPTLDNLADHLADFMKKKGLTNSILFGSSMGGTLAIRIAARHPELARALALQGIMTQPDDLRESDYKRIQTFTNAHVRRIIELPGVSWFAKQILKQGTRFQDDFKVADEQGKRQMLRDTGKAEVHSYMLALQGIGQDLGEEINNINAPVVLLDGENSVVVSIDKTKKIAGRFHPEISDEDPRENLRKKIAERQVLFYKIGGVTGEHAHSVLNTFPEGMAVMINHAISNYFKV